MKNKFLSSLMAVIMVLSCLSAVSVAATVELPANIGTDFTPVPLTERTDNVITDPYGWSNTGLPGGWTFAAPSSATSYNGEYTLTSSVATQISNGANWTDDEVGRDVARGIRINKSKCGGMTIYQPGATLVFSADVISWNPNNPKLTWGIWQASKKAILPMEYPTRTAGFATSNTAWTRFGGTVAIPETCEAIGNAMFTLGFSQMDAPAGTSNTEKYGVRIRAASMYLAVEAASDIKVTADKTSIIVDGSRVVNVDADILNQVGSKGNLSQSATWYVTNKERTEAISGCSVVQGADGSATITLPDTLGVGEYCIVAVSGALSADGETLVKGLPITIKGYDDYVPEGNAEDGNIITDTTEYSMTYHPAFTVYDDYLKLSHGTNVSVNDNRPVQGYLPKRTTYDNSALVAGNALVFSAKIKATNGKPRFNWGVKPTQATNSAIWPVEYNGKTEGMLITATEDYQTYTSTVVLPDDFVYSEVLADGSTAYAQLNFGMPHTPDGESEGARSMEILREGMYLGIERMYDIKLSANTTTWIPGKTGGINLDVDILNQVGTTGALDQDVTWKIFHEGRTVPASGITVETTDVSTGKALLTVDDFTVAPGKYEIVAVSEENGDFIKGITIEVKEADSHLASIEQVAADAGKFKAMAKLMDCSDNDKNINAGICVVLMDAEGKLINYNFTAVSDSYDAQRTEDTKYCEITLTGDTDKVLVFLLDCGEASTPTIFDATVKELARMQEFSIN